MDTQLLVKITPACALLPGYVTNGVRKINWHKKCTCTNSK